MVVRLSDLQLRSYSDLRIVLQVDDLVQGLVVVVVVVAMARHRGEAERLGMVGWMFWWWMAG